MDSRQQSPLRIEATDSQASMLEQRLTELEEQHGPGSGCAVSDSKRSKENSVRRILSDIGFRVREADQLREDR